jgi:hypothetical protein
MAVPDIRHATDEAQSHAVDTLASYARRRCDEDHLPAYLESSNPRNVPLYERHGFTVIGAIQAGTSPTMYPMVRAAR